VPVLQCNNSGGFARVIFRYHRSNIRNPGSKAMTRTKWLLGAVLVLALLGGPGLAQADDANDYPTAVRSDYVFGCMKANGDNRLSLDQCACSIDVVASLLPYARYVTAETVLSMAQVQGNLGGQFRSSPQATTALADLRRAQAEAEVRCF
jgi:hypothetical protein